ncbi:uncharacterized protein LOC143914516 [Arctopsyche grandis]|uniref:uncharacterized protein LOC143914516 n=1 Tax=Arctopsyche grandis TaxID=121162 RepID=UPI00406D6D90
MAELIEPNFSTTWFSIQWMKTRWHPNMLPYRHDTIINILETGLLFREDSFQIEDGLQIESNFHEKKIHRTKFNLLRLTPGERVLSAVAVGVCIATIPLKFPINTKSNLYKALCWAGTGITVPIIHRWLVPNTLPTLLQSLSEYTTLVRKCLSCIKEQSLHSRSHWGMSVDAMNSMLIQQHQELCSLFNKCIAYLQKACPWLSSTMSWELSLEVTPIVDSENLMKLHHLFLILQSTLLKSIAMTHLTPPLYAARLNKNHNERIYWIHSKLIPYILEPTQDFLAMLNNNYRIFREYANRDNMTMKNLPKINREPWQYSEVHASVLLCSSEIRSALTKVNEMDTFLEACWNAKSKFSPAILEEDLAKLKDDLVKCFATIDNTGIQLKKIRMAEMKLIEQAVQKLHLPAVEEEEIDVEKNNIKSVNENTEMNIRDQVFYYEKTEDDRVETKADDYLTGPGKEEIQATKIVLGELKRKLVKREDEMRLREATALEDTMPEYKGKIPDFPRQIYLQDEDIADTSSEENSITSNSIDKSLPQNEIVTDKDIEINNKTLVSKGIISKIDPKPDKDVVDQIEQTNGCDIIKNGNSYNNNNQKMLLTNDNKQIEDDNFDNSDFSESDDSAKIKLLEDVRKNRITRKKNYPQSNALKPGYKKSRKLSNGDDDLGNSSRESDKPNGSNASDEDLQPVEYSFGTGMAMASLLHISRPKIENQNMFGNGEEVFIGDGEVSDDSGNEA